MYIVYKITRDDGELYIGTTYRKGLAKRMKAHSKTNRFKSHKFEFVIVEESDDFEYIESREEYYIGLYDTFYNGLNKSINGKGNHLCSDFTTKNYKFSDESRERMSQAAKARVARCGVPFKGKSHTKEQKEKWRSTRKGVQQTTKINEDSVKEIISIFEKQPSLEGVGQVMGNGRKMSYVRAFSLRYCNDYDITPENVERIIRGRTWKNVERKYKL